MQPQTPRFNEWLVAEKDANEIERKLHRAMLESAQDGIPVDGDLVLLARAKRAKAHWLFDEAMREMKVLAEALHGMDGRSLSSNEQGSSQPRA